MEPSSEQTNNQEPVSASMPPSSEEKKHYGPLMGIIVIIVLLCLGGLYFFSERLGGLWDDGSELELMSDGPDPMTEELRTYSDSDELSDIEADLNATSLDAIDAEIDDIEADLQAQ